MRDLLPETDKRIWLVHLGEPRYIGDKRNYGCERANGEVICHWDDDDYSAPERIEKQVELLIRSKRSIVGFHTMRFTDGERDWLYSGDDNYALGTSLCYRRSWWEAHPFESKQIGEDNSFVTFAQRFNEVASVNAEELMYATIHQGNTSPRGMGSKWKAL